MLNFCSPNSGDNGGGWRPRWKGVTLSSFFLAPFPKLLGLLLNNNKPLKQIQRKTIFFGPKDNKNLCLHDAPYLLDFNTNYTVEACKFT